MFCLLFKELSNLNRKLSDNSQWEWEWEAGALYCMLSGGIFAILHYYCVSSTLSLKGSSSHYIHSDLPARLQILLWVQHPLLCTTTTCLAGHITAAYANMLLFPMHESQRRYI